MATRGGTKLRHMVEVVEEEKQVVTTPVEQVMEPETEAVFGAEGEENVFGTNIDQSESGGNIWIWVLVGLVIAGIVSGIWLFFMVRRDRQQTEEEQGVVVSPTPLIELVDTPAVTATPAATVKLSDLKIEVLNGSGVKGQAGIVADLLKKAGATKVDTANAKKFDYEDIEVSYKPSAKPVAATIEKALEDYTITEGDALEKTDKYDVIVIVGKTANTE